MCWGFMPHNLIFGFGNKMSIIEYIKHIGITFDVFTNEQQDFGNNSIRNHKYCKIQPIKYTLVSP